MKVILENKIKKKKKKRRFNLFIIFNYTSLIILNSTTINSFKMVVSHSVHTALWCPDIGISGHVTSALRGLRRVHVQEAVQYKQKY